MPGAKSSGISPALNKRVREAMRLVGETDRSLAARVGVGSSTLSSYLTGRAPWPPPVLYAVAEIVHIDEWVAAAEIGVLPGDAERLVMSANAALWKPLLGRLLHVDAEQRDPTLDVVAAVLAADCDPLVAARERGKRHRGLYDVCVGACKRARDKRTPQEVRDAVDAHLRSGGAEVHWEINADLLPQHLRAHPTLIVEQRFGPQPHDRPIALRNGPIFVGGPYYSGAKDVPRHLHDLLGLASVNVSGVVAAGLGETGAFRGTFVQQAVVTQAMRFPPHDALVAAVNDYEVLVAAMQKLIGGKVTELAGSCFVLTLDDALLDYAAFHVARAEDEERQRHPGYLAGTKEEHRERLEQGQRALVDLSRKLFGSTAHEVGLRLPKVIKVDANGDWPDAVDLMFDLYYDVAVEIAEIIDPGGRLRDQRPND